MSTLNVSIDTDPEVVPAGGAGNRPRYDWMGFDREVRRSNGGNAGGASAPDVPPFGMTSEELFQYQRVFTQYAAERLVGIGHDQYARDGAQKFEHMTVRELVIGLREELADIVNYATMLDIQLYRFYREVSPDA